MELHPAAASFLTSKSVNSASSTREFTSATWRMTLAATAATSQCLSKLEIEDSETPLYNRTGRYLLFFKVFFPNSKLKNLRHLYFAELDISLFFAVVVVAVVLYFSFQTAS